MKVSKIEKVSLREVWKHEASDFTKWLQENLDVINDTLDLNLTNAEREQSAGSFNVDLVAEDDKLGVVIIENQLEKSNHDHLGKVLTYLNAYEAKVAIWIVSDARSEHVDVISWLNKSIEDHYFYMLQVEAIKIGQSSPAALLTKIVGPSDEIENIGRTKKGLKERHIKRLQFWSELLEYSKTKTSLHSGISSSKHSWIATGSGKRGFTFNYCINQKEGRVEVCIDRGKDSGDENLKIYNHFFKHKNEIEKSFGCKLLWEDLEGKRACRVKFTSSKGGFNSDKYDDLIEEMVHKMILLEKAFRPFVDSLKI